jgi:hypothetical protein
MIKIPLSLILCLSLSSNLIAQMYDPFQKTSKQKSSLLSPLLPPPSLMMAMLPPALSVSAITDDKAFISGKWYRIGESIGSKKVAYIQSNFVGLQEGSHLTVLTLGSKHHLFDIKETQ